MKTNICALIILLFSFSRSRACTCLPPPAGRESWEEAYQVFTGEVLDSSHSQDHEIRFNIRVLEVFKYGRLKSGDVINFTFAGDGMCGFYFHVGRKYVIYAVGDKDGKNIGASSCTRTTMLNWVPDSDLKLLRKFHQESELKRKKAEELSYKERIKKRDHLIMIISLIVSISVILTLIFVHYRNKHALRERSLIKLLRTPHTPF